MHTNQSITSTVYINYVHYIRFRLIFQRFLKNFEQKVNISNYFPVILKLKLFKIINATVSTSSTWIQRYAIGTYWLNFRCCHYFFTSHYLSGCRQPNACVKHVWSRRLRHRTLKGEAWNWMHYHLCTTISTPNVTFLQERKRYTYVVVLRLT